MVTHCLRNMPNAGESAGSQSDVYKKVRPISLSGALSVASGIKPDILILSSKYSRDAHSIPENTSCGILLTPSGKMQELSKNIKADTVISYGMSPKDSITLSSIEPGSIMLSIQRELPTLSDTILERQDIPVRSPDGAAPEDAMAFSAAMLLAGIPPENLMSLS